MPKKVVIIGGGVVGLCTAWYLLRSGWQTTIIDANHFQDACSYGNAGYISPSHVVPLSAPGMISKGIRWMFDPKSPFYIHLKNDPMLWRWLWQFGKHANNQHLVQSRQILADLCLFSKNCYLDILQSASIQAGYKEHGLLMLFQTEQQKKKEIIDANHVRATGQKAEILSATEIQRMEPELDLNILGGVFYSGDAHLDPALFMNGLKEALIQHGAAFFLHDEVQELVHRGKSIVALRTNSSEFEVNNIVLAAGAWSSVLLRKLGYRLLLEAARGYHLDVASPAIMPNTPFILTERKIAVTPMSGFLRFAGTLELSGFASGINKHRIQGIVNGLKQYLPQFVAHDFDAIQPWAGLRPCSPDGLPYIGKINGIENMIVATGHAMLGMTLGAGTGRLVDQMINGSSSSINMKPFRLDRFG